MDKYLSDNILSLVKALKESDKTFKAVIGADGFVDTILDPVNERKNATEYSVIRTMEEYGQRIVNAAGMATNIELVPLQYKLGGNGPIFANALSEQSIEVTYIGSLGMPAIHPVFEQLAEKATCFSLCEPGYTDAIEFEDGKLMNGKITSLNDVTWENMKKVVGLDELIKLVDECDLFGMENWTMVPYMTEIFEGFLEEVMPKVIKDMKKIAFFDLADPEKRTDEDRKKCLKLISEFSKYRTTILGINKKEVYELANTIGSDEVKDTSLREFDVEKAAMDIYNYMDIDTLMIHPVDRSFSIKDGNIYKSISPYTKTPKLTTGGGDNYNAGYCIGALMDLDQELSLLLGGSVSGYYVRQGRSPSKEDIIGFLEKWHNDGTI